MVLGVHATEKPTCPWRLGQPIIFTSYLIGQQQSGIGSHKGLTLQSRSAKSSLVHPFRHLS